MSHGNLKYKEEYNDMLISHMSRGLSFESFAGEIGVAKSTLYKWKVEIPPFQEAFEIGYSRGLKLYETLLVNKCTGRETKFGNETIDPRKGDTTALIFAMKTRFHKVYGDRGKVEVENGNDGIVIKIDRDDAEL